MLGAGSEHAVGLLGAQSHQIVHQHGHVGRVPARREGRQFLFGAGDVQGGPEALGRGFLITGGAVDLPGQPEPRHVFAFQCGAQLHGVHVIVFDGVARPDHDRALQAGDAAQHGHLHVQGQAGGNAVGIDLRAVQALGLQKNLMPFPLGKAGHLVLNGGAVTRAYALDHAGEQRRAVEAAADDFVGAAAGPGDMAGNLGQDRAGAVKTECRRRRVAALFLQAGKVDGRAQKSRGGAGFQAAQFQAQSAQAAGKAQGRGVAQAAARQVGQADVDAPVQKCAGGQQHMPGREFQTLSRAHARDAARVRDDVRDRVLPEAQAGRGVECFFQDALISVAVHLGSRGANGRALAHVQGAELDARRVGPEAHHAAQGVDFAHHMALGQAADGRIAGKIAQAVQIAADQQHVETQPGQGHGGFGAGVAAAGDDAVKTGVRHGHPAA